MVDWSAWGRSFGVRKSIKDSERQEEMDIRDYIGYQKGRGYSDAEARAMWKVLEDDPRSDIDGEGAEKTIMIQLKQQRARDTERYEDGAYQEGSKQAKAMGDDEKRRSRTLLLPVLRLLAIARSFAGRSVGNQMTRASMKQQQLRVQAPSRRANT